MSAVAAAFVESSHSGLFRTMVQVL